MSAQRLVDSRSLKGITLFAKVFRMNPQRQTIVPIHGLWWPATHAILAAVTSVGPTPDIDQLEEVMGELPPWFAMHHLVGDAGFDSASNHRFLRESLAIRSTIPPQHGRPPNDPATLPKDKYRRLMKTRFNKKAYRRRPQAETVF